MGHTYCGVIEGEVTLELSNHDQSTCSLHGHKLTVRSGQATQTISLDDREAELVEGIIERANQEDD